MDISISKSLNKTIMTISGQEGAASADDSLQMVIQNEIPHLVSLQFEEIDSQIRLVYDISSRISLQDYMESSRLSRKDLTGLVKGIGTCSQALQEYLLDPAFLMLRADCLFLDPVKKECFYCFNPFYKGSQLEDLQALFERIIACIDYRDQEAVRIAYEIFAAVQGDNLNWKEVERILRQSASREKNDTVLEDVEQFIHPHRQSESDRMRRDVRERNTKSASLTHWNDKQPDCFSESYLEDSGSRPRKLRKKNDANNSWDLWKTDPPGRIGIETVEDAQEDSWDLWNENGNHHAPDRRNAELADSFSPDPAADYAEENFEKSRPDKTEDESFWQKTKRYMKNHSFREVLTDIDDGLILQKIHSEPAAEPVGTFPGAGGSSGRSMTDTLRQGYPNSREENARVISDPGKRRTIRPRFVLEGIGKMEDCVIELSEFPFYIGKYREKSDYVLDRKTVSRSHLCICEDPDQKGCCLMVDQQSRNGTYLNGKRLRPFIKTRVSPGDHVRIADAEFVFHCS